MATITCKKCGSLDVFIKPNGTQTGAYCSDCGAWIKWVGKDEQRLIERQIERNKEIAVVEEEEEEIVYDLSQFSNEELLEEIHRRMR